MRSHPIIRANLGVISVCSKPQRISQGARQQQGLRYDSPLTLIDDADTQARWYYRLKREYRHARAEGRPFKNPVEPRTIKWRS